MKLGLHSFCSTNRGTTFHPQYTLEYNLRGLLSHSAALDPEAEYGMTESSYLTRAITYDVVDLFERLRKLRGSKTMIFSSHRFGNLTRHADLILFVVFFLDILCFTPHHL
jgi:hypothetical protein